MMAWVWLVTGAVIGAVIGALGILVIAMSHKLKRMDREIDQERKAKKDGASKI